jgi:hypothetical protein
MKMTQETEILKSQKLDSVFEDLKKVIVRAVRENQPVHEVEKALWEQVKRIGRQALTQVFALLGNGDMGDSITLPDGRHLQRLEQEHRRCYRSIFGEFELSRVVYGSREGQKIEFVPLDNRLQLPESASTEASGTLMPPFSTCTTPPSAGQVFAGESTMACSPDE